MKRLIATIFILSTIFLTACNNQTTETSTSTNKTEQTESTSVSQTTENTQTSETTFSTQESLSSETTTEKTETTEVPQGYEIPAGLQNILVGVQQLNLFAELPSRILFSHSLDKGKWIGDRYQYNGGEYTVYYSKADGEIYVNCFDPLCDHTSCSATSHGIGGSQQFFIDNRIYELSPWGEILSYNFDGTDKVIELDLEYEFRSGLPSPWGANHIAYGQYIFIERMMENEELHTFRYDTKNKLLEDLTEKTGFYIMPMFAYNGEIYGQTRDGLYIKTDISLSYVKETENYYEDGLYTLSSGSCFIGIARNKEDSASSLGIQIFDIQTGIKTVITNETIGHTVQTILYADENYYYFLANAPVYIGKSRSKNDIYNLSGGKIYRVNRDGTNCICIYDNKGMTFNSMIVYEDTVIVSASEIGVHGGIAQTWANGMYIGEINEDGTIDSLEWVEVIA